MRNRIFSGILAVSLCLSTLQPVTSLAVGTQKQLVQAWTWAESQEGQLDYNEAAGQWELSAPEEITEEELREQLPAAVLAELAPEGESEEPTPAPEGEPEESAPAPEGEPEEPTPAPEGESEESDPAPEGESEESDPAPEGEPEEPTPAPEGEPEESDPAPEGEPEESDPAPEGESEESAPAPEGEPEESDPAPEGESEESAPAPEGEPEEPTLAPENEPRAVRTLSLRPVSTRNTAADEMGESDPAPEGKPEEPTPAPEGEPGEPAPAPEGEPEEPTPAPEGEPEESDPAPEGESEESDPAPEGKPEEPAPAPEGEPEEPTPAPEGEPEEPTPEESQPQTVVLELHWTVGDLSTLADGEPVLATATLPEGYALAEGAAPLAVAVLPRAAVVQMYGAPVCDWDQYTGFEVDAAELSGTKINLFDYWTEADENGNVTEETRYYTDSVPFYDGDRPDKYDRSFERFRQGINKDTVYKFCQGGYRSECPIDWEDYNIWTGNANPHTGIVEKILDDRYPVLAKEPGDFDETYKIEGENIGNNPAHVGKYWYDQINDKVRSLDYLFDPKMEHSGKASYENVKGLLQVDEDGYYYYDSTQNYAAFDANFIDPDGNGSGKPENVFRLYNKPAAPGNNTDATQSGQFFPFNTPNQVFNIVNDQLEAITAKPNDDPQKPDTMSLQPFINHYFGMTMTTRFAQKNGGTTYRGKETTYEFSGDDDVWVFIDDVLVADLGGIHNAASLSINFTNGNVEVAGTTTTIREQFKAAGREGKPEDWRDNTFADDTYHTLRFFFLERGNNESNVALKFNMVVIPESGIQKTSQSGTPVAGAHFALYPAAKDENGKYSITNVNPIYEGTTGVEGKLQLVDEETGGALAFEELAELGGSNCFVLREESVPAGYRQNSDTYLYYDPDTDVIVSENEWQTGSHSQTMVTATLQNEVHKIGSNSQPDGDPLEPYDDDTLKPEDFYAVVFRYMGDKKITSKDILATTTESDWRPVVSNENNMGWEVLEGMETNAAIAEAIQKKPYQAKLAPDGSYKLVVTGLPGDPNSYYHLWSKKLAAGKEAGQLLYTVNFYHKEGDTYQRLDPEDFGRDFSVRLFIPNIKNHLVVHKVAKGGTSSLTGAEFRLYKAENVTVNGDGTYTIKPGASPYDTVMTRDLNQANGDPITAKGCATFPSKKEGILEVGEYYLIEAKAPQNYKPYKQAIHVIVDNAGVYVDAGKPGDGLTTSRYVGTLVHSMRQFAVDDKVDATLHDIKVQMQTTDHYEYIAGSTYADKATWSPWNPSPGEKQELHLNYQGKANEFGSTYHSTDDGFRILGTEDEGWSQLYIRQCMNEEHSKLNSPKQELGDQNLRNLFSTVMVVHVENEPENSPDPGPDPSTVDVSVKKVWEMSSSRPKPESVQVELLRDGTAVEGKTVTLNEANNWAHTWDQLDANSTWTVREVNVPEGFTSTVTKESTLFTITNKETTPDPGPKPDPDPDPDPGPGPRPDPDPDPGPPDKPSEPPKELPYTGTSPARMLAGLLAISGLLLLLLGLLNRGDDDDDAQA